ncbi:hypothetical protein JST56_01930 [Candidatus Dependentiae bacterium]|jgi:hypothetical protein|nr:hypothetical protein [Candidatus Dependentiae bacterium]
MTEQEIAQYNYRQIILMESRVTLYKDNKLSIKEFIDDIDALIGWIKNPPNNWVKDLKRLLWEIEIPFATALAHGEDLTPEKLQQISLSVDKIRECVLWYKQNCLPTLDDENL